MPGPNSSVIGTVKTVRRVAKGIKIFNQTGSTPEWAYFDLITLFCDTNGVSNDLIHKWVTKNYPPVKIENPSGVLGNLADSDVTRICSDIDENGYHIFDQKLSPEACDRLTEFALTTPALLRPKRDDLPDNILYDRANPLTETYRFMDQSLLESDQFQKLIADPTILAVAQAYLRCQPILDLVTMWWSTAYNPEASSAAAQLYHFDMDRIKWIKFFFYLTDVTTDTGPHCYVAGTHRSKAQPKELLKRGMCRLPDEDVARFIPADKFIEINGARGSIIAVDTRGYHKGKPLVTGDRLLLQLEFADSLFGKDYPKASFGKKVDPALEKQIALYPRIYSHYTD